MYTQARQALAPTRTPAIVLRQKTTHRRSYGKNSPLYMHMVNKWRFHYYGIIHKVFENAGQFDFPIAYYEFGRRILELAENAEILLKEAKPEEKRELVQYMLSNSTLKDGEPDFR